MNASVTLVIFEGGAIGSSLEKDLRLVRKGVVIDKIAKAYQAGFERIILCTPYKDLAKEAAGYGVEVELEQLVAEDFHFGKKLLKTVKEKQLSRVLYMGGAAAPLISSEELGYIRQLLLDHERVVTANNYYSADFVGFSPGAALEEIELPAIDNSLASVLVEEADLRFISLQRTLGLQFDLDTPSELLTLAVHPGIGLNTKKAIAEIKLNTSRCEQIKEVIRDPYAELLVFGRVGSTPFRLLDELSRCKIRLYSEERGLKASGRDVRGEAVSLVAKMVDTMGYVEFFQFLEHMCHGAVLDTRVLFAHFRWDLSQSDRFHSDLGQIDKIVHPELRKFTIAAYDVSIPVMLGGHSLVTGGMWALIESSYLERLNK